MNSSCTFQFRGRSTVHCGLAMNGRCVVRIGEVAEVSGMTTKALRFYEDRGLLPRADRTSNGYREYGQDTVLRLDFIRRSRISGLTLAQIGDILRVRDDGAAPCGHVSAMLATQLKGLDQQIEELIALRGTVAAHHAAVAAADPAVCDAEQICSYL